MFASACAGDDGLAEGALLVRAEYPDAAAMCDETLGQGGEVPHRPALGRAEFRTRAKRDDGAAAIQGQLRQRDQLVRRVNFEVRLGQRALGCLSRHFGQLGIAVGHQRQ